MRNIGSLKVVLLGLFAFGFAGCLDVEAEIPEIEVTQRGLSFQGTQLSRLVGEMSTTASYNITQDDLPFDKSLLKEVDAYEVTLTAGDVTTPDLDFIRNLRVSVAGRNGAGATEIANYERIETQKVGRKLLIKHAVPIAVTEALNAGNTKLLVEIAGMLPENDWTLDVGVKLQAKGKATYKIASK